MARARAACLAERVLGGALPARHDLAVDQHALACEDRGQLGLLAQHRKADGAARAERGRKQKQRQHARQKPQIEAGTLREAKRREDQRPDADQHHQIALLGETVIGDAPRHGDEQQHDRQSRKPHPIAPEQANQRAARLAARIAEQQRRGAGEQIAHHHGAERALGQLPGERDLGGISVEDGGVDEQQRHSHEFHQRGRGAHGEVLLLARVIGSVKRRGAKARKLTGATIPRHTVKIYS